MMANTFLLWKMEDEQSAELGYWSSEWQNGVPAAVLMAFSWDFEGPVHTPVCNYRKSCPQLQCMNVKDFLCLKWKVVSISKDPKLWSDWSQGHTCSFISTKPAVIRGIKISLQSYMRLGKLPWKHRSMRLLLHFSLSSLFIWWFRPFIITDKKVSRFEIW